MSILARLLLSLAAVVACAAQAVAMPDDLYYSCEQDFSTNIGPPGMAQPNGSFQTTSQDCSGIMGCNDYFDITMQAGDELILTFCADGGSVSFPSDLSVWSGPTFDVLEMCSGIDCGTTDDLDFVAEEAGTYRVRVGESGYIFNLPYMLGGPYTLAYSAPVTSTIVPAACGNGTLDAGEACDDGNDVGGDCCSASCQFESSGSACADEGNDCTVDQCDGAGTCTHPNAAVATPCTPDDFFCTDDVCDGAGSCTHPDIPDCNQQPACGVPTAGGDPLFPHPKSAIKVTTSLVQAFVSCNNPGGNTPNTTTDGGVPACSPVQTYNERAGSPQSGWLWREAGSKGDLTLYQRCKGAADVGIKLTMSGIVDGTGALVNGTGALVIGMRFTLHDPSNGDMMTGTIPVTAGFTVLGGTAKLLTSVNAFFAENELPPLPNGVSVEFLGLDTSDNPLLEVRDQNGNPFARPGVFLR